LRRRMLLSGRVTLTMSTRHRQSLTLRRCRLTWRRSSSTMRGSTVALHMLYFISTHWYMVSQQPALATTQIVSAYVFDSQIHRSSLSSLLSILSYMHLPDICPNMYRNRILDVPIVYRNRTAYVPKLHKQNCNVPNMTSFVPKLRCAEVVHPLYRKCHVPIWTLPGRTTVGPKRLWGIPCRWPFWFVFIIVNIAA